jgi:hypothetical protein
VNGINDSHPSNGINGHTERKLGVYDDVHFDPKLQPKNYQIKGRHLRRAIRFQGPLTVYQEPDPTLRFCSSM